MPCVNNKIERNDFMKYTQYSRKKKGSSALYIAIALCFVFIGVLAWFGFTQVNSTPEPQSSSSLKNQTDSQKEYFESTSSYNNSSTNQGIVDFTQPDTQKEKPKEQENLTQTEAETKQPKEKAYTMPVNGDILKDFSLKNLQYSATYGDMRIHPAVDIACSEGTLISAVCDGTVQNIETTADYGKIVTIDHGDSLIIKYCGLKNITIEKDAPVRMGDSIGAVGTIPCECSDQSHLHIEAYQNGNPVSILKFFP